MSGLLKGGGLRNKAIALAIMQAVLHEKANKFVKPMTLTFNGLDISAPQKVLLPLFFMTYLWRYEMVQIKPLEQFATYSFGIYFVHPYLLQFIKRLPNSIFGDFFQLEFLVLKIVTLSIIFSLVEIVKHLLPKWSRMIIGC